MYKITDFKKGCPMCQAVSRSHTKKNCDYCHAKLVNLPANRWQTRYASAQGRFEWGWEGAR